MQNKDVVKCPLMDDEPISISKCEIYSEVADNYLRDSCAHESFKDKENWKEICLKCHYHE